MSLRDQQLLWSGVLAQPTSLLTQTPTARATRVGVAAAVAVVAMILATL